MQFNSCLTPYIHIPMFSIFLTYGYMKLDCATFVRISNMTVNSSLFVNYEISMQSVQSVSS